MAPRAQRVTPWRMFVSRLRGMEDVMNRMDYSLNAVFQLEVKCLHGRIIQHETRAVGNF